LINTERLKLKPHKIENLDSLHFILGNSETMSFYPKPYSKKDTENIIKKSIRLFERQQIGFFAVFLKSNKSFIGN